MSLREALKADFGIEVRVNRGSGQRDDPFVIEPCTAAEAVRTQLDLPRGLSRGRRELWRLLTVEPAGDDTPAMQRETGLLDDNDGVLSSHNWSARQFKNDISNERVKRYRQRHSDVTAAVTVTAPDTDTGCPDSVKLTLFGR